MNWDQIFFKAIIPISFAAIWVLTSLFNRESKGFPARPANPNPPVGPRPGDPTLRWGSPPTSTAPKPPANRRVPIGDDDILIISNDPARPNRPAPGRPLPSAANRRSSKLRAPAPKPKAIEAPPARTMLSGVTQNVNQHLADPVEMRPLTTIAPMSNTHGSDLANAPSAPSVTSEILTVSKLIPMMNDPIRLREAFIVNELLQAPIALRPRRGHRR